MGGGLFGRHAADVMRWPRGHGVGVGHHSPWSYAGADKECLHGRYGVGVGNHSPCICDGRRSEGPRTMVGVLFSARQAASVADGRVAIKELAVDHTVADGREVGGSRKAHSVSTLSNIQEQEPSSGWSCGYRMGLAAREGARAPEDTRGLRQLVTSAGG